MVFWCARSIALRVFFLNLLNRTAPSQSRENFGTSVSFRIYIYSQLIAGFLFILLLVWQLTPFLFIIFFFFFLRQVKKGGSCDGQDSLGNNFGFFWGRGEGSNVYHDYNE